MKNPVRFFAILIVVSFFFCPLFVVGTMAYTKYLMCLLGLITSICK